MCRANPDPFGTSFLSNPLFSGIADTLHHNCQLDLTPYMQKWGKFATNSLMGNDKEDFGKSELVPAISAGIETCVSEKTPLEEPDKLGVINGCEKEILTSELNRTDLGKDQNEIQWNKKDWPQVSAGSKQLKYVKKNSQSTSPSTSPMIGQPGALGQRTVVAKHSDQKPRQNNIIMLSKTLVNPRNEEVKMADYEKKFETISAAYNSPKGTSSNAGQQANKNQKFGLKKETLISPFFSKTDEITQIPSVEVGINYSKPSSQSVKESPHK